MTDNNMGKRIRELRLSNKLTLEQVAQYVGVGKSTVRKWETGMIANMKRDKIASLAAVLKTSPAYLMGWEEERNFESVSLQKTVRRINVLGSVPAGIPTEAVEDIIDWEELPEEMFAGGKEYFGLRVSGDSMWPDILDGDIVIIRKTPTCDSGSIAVVYVNGYDATLKQVKIAEDGSITLQPRNPNYPPRTYSPKEVEELPVSIAGVVVELRRKWGL